MLDFHRNRATQRPTSGILAPPSEGAAMTQTSTTAKSDAPIGNDACQGGLWHREPCRVGGAA